MVDKKFKLTLKVTYLCQLFDQPMDSNLKPLQSKVSWWRQSAAARSGGGGGGRHRAGGALRARR